MTEKKKTETEKEPESESPPSKEEETPEPRLFSLQVEDVVTFEGEKCLVQHMSQDGSIDLKNAKGDLIIVSAAVHVKREDTDELVAVMRNSRVQGFYLDDE